MKKLASMLLVFLMMFSLFTACGTNENDTHDSDEVEDESAEDTTGDDTSEGEKEPESDPEPEKPASFPYEISAEKIGTINQRYIYAADGGLYYNKTEGDVIKYGIISLDGTKDSGAIYADCRSKGNYFVVTSVSTEYAAISDLNRYGVVDANGNTIVPQEYASVSIINDRYIRVCKVTEATESESEALVYYTDSLFSLGPHEGDTMFKGTWHIYDAIECKPLEGVSGTKSNYVSAYGDYIKYTADDCTTYTIDETGTALPEGANLFTNGDGSYELKDGGTGKIYDTDNNLRFEYNLSDYRISTMDEKGYYHASKSIGDTTVYFLIDKEGTRVTEHYSSNPTVVIEGIVSIYVSGTSSYSLYNYSGELILANVKSYHVDEVFGGCVIAIDNNNNCYYLDANGKIVTQTVLEDEVVMVDSYLTMGCYKKNDSSTTFYYNFGTQSYSIESDGYDSTAPWMISRENAGETEDLINLFTGENLLSGYYSYSYENDPNGYSYYIYAKVDGSDTYDIYLITAK